MKAEIQGQLEALRVRYLEPRDTPLPQHVWWEGMTEEEKMREVPPLIEQYPRIKDAIEELGRKKNPAEPEH